jgi:hypothetical protein
MNNPFNPNARPASQVPMSQIDSYRNQTQNAGMPSSVPMNQSANPTAPTRAVNNFAGGMQPQASAPSSLGFPTPQAQSNRPAMPTQAVGGQANRSPMPPQTNAGGQRPDGLPAQANQSAQSRLASIPPQARAQLSQRVQQRIRPMVQQADQRIQQLRASNASPQAINQVMAQLDNLISAEEASAIQEYFGQQA